MNGDAGIPDAPASARLPVSGSSPSSAAEFRWQALFQRSREPVFVLNRRRRILFANQAWEKLTGISSTEARGLACVRRSPVPGDTWDVVVRALCCPPPEVLKGKAERSRRLVPGTGVAARWWDVEFLPLHDEGGLLCIVGKISVVGPEGSSAAPPLPEKLVALREARRQRYSLAEFAGEVPACKRVIEQVRLAGESRAPVLILGEPGTGKETVARTIHCQGSHHGAFVSVGCARLPVSALAALLAAPVGPGRRASKGTCYLKEPQFLPREIQMRLSESLRGEPGVDAPRVIAGVSTEPAEEVKAGRLLEDLHCALGTLVIPLPALRDRLLDLPALVERFLKRVNLEAEHAVEGLTDKAWELLRAYAWPGNLRELFAALQFASLQTRNDRIDAGHLPGAVRLAVRLAATAPAGEEKKLSLDRFLEEAERRLIRLALRRAKGNRSRAAELLEIWRPRLLRRMEALGITDW